MPMLVLWCLLLTGWQHGAHGACTLQQRGSVTFTAAAGEMLVPLSVNGNDATFVLDTGADRSLVTPAAVQRLGLVLDEWVGTTMRGVGGVVEHRNANPRSLLLGGIALQLRTITHDTSLTVGALRFNDSGGPVIDGLLGRDFLALFDLELDMIAHRLTLYDVRGCTGRFLPWTGDYAAVAASVPMTNALVLPMTIDGTRLRALLDTGAAGTLIAAPGIVRLGLTPALLAKDQGAAVHGVGPQSPPIRRHRFASMQIGPQITTDPLLWVAPVRLVPIVDALLGGDWLALQRRVWISFATAQVFFAPR